MSKRRSIGRKLTVCGLFWLGLVTSEALAEEVAHSHICVRMSCLATENNSLSSTHCVG